MQSGDWTVWEVAKLAWGSECHTWSKDIKSADISTWDLVESSLQVFCDASQMAYIVVIYLRNVCSDRDSEGSLYCCKNESSTSLSCHDDSTFGVECISICSQNCAESWCCTHTHYFEAVYVVWLYCCAGLARSANNFENKVCCQSIDQYFESSEITKMCCRWKHCCMATCSNKGQTSPTHEEDAASRHAWACIFILSVIDNAS